MKCFNPVNNSLTCKKNILAINAHFCGKIRTHEQINQANA